MGFSLRDIKKWGLLKRGTTVASDVGAIPATMTGLQTVINGSTAPELSVLQASVSGGRIGSVAVTGTPVVGQIPIATGPSTAAWQTPTTGSVPIEILAGSNDQLVGAGDSIMQGLTAPNTISIPLAVKAYCETLKLCAITNDGVPGSRLKTNLIGGSASAADLVARYATNIYPKRPAATGARRSILLVDIGANDFQVISLADVAVWCSVWDAYCTQARADGFIVIAFTIMRRGNEASTDNTTQNNNKRLLMNDFIRRSRNIDEYVDAALLIDDMTDTQLVIDLTHPTDRGNIQLGRATTSSIERVGLRIPLPAMPAATLRPALPAATVDVLERAAVACLDYGGNTTALKTPIPAFGTGDFTVTWWGRREPGAAGSNVQVLTGNGTAFGMLLNGSDFGQVYAQPPSTWSWPDLFVGVYHFCAVIRSAGVTTYYIDGVARRSVADTASYAALNKFLDLSASAKIARPRAWARALSAAELKAQIDSLSAFAVGQDYVFALDDACRHAGYYIDDLSATGAHFKIVDPTKAAINSPGRRGAARFQTVGSVVVAGFLPLNTRVTAWAANVSVSGGGTVDLSDANGTGRYFNGTGVATGLKSLALAANPIAISSSSLYCNATGYTIEHVVDFLLL